MRSIITQIMNLTRFISCDIGIDLGTANVRVGIREQGLVAIEPSVIAVQRGTNKILAVGKEAKEMIGKTPANVIATRPIRDGVIVDFDTTQAMLKYFISRALKNFKKNNLFLNPRVLIGVPSTITDVEKQAVIDAALYAGAKEAYVIEEPMAAAIGVGLPINDATGNMIVDIGGGTTDIAIISLGGILVDKTIKLAGDEMDEKIIEYVKNVYGLAIGNKTAESLKLKLGNVYEDEHDETLIIHGRDLTTGLPKSTEITATHIKKAILPVIQQITDAIKEAIEDAPPEIVSDLTEKGFIITGGGSQIKGLNDYWQKIIGIPVKRANEPQISVLKGTLEALGHVDILKKLKESENMII